MTVGIQLFIYLCYKKRYYKNLLEQVAQMEAHMKQKKNKGLFITVIILLIILVLLVGVVAYLYVFTDMFKSNKQLFFKYTSQIVQNEDGFIDNAVRQYFQKKNSTSYENNGEITFEVSIPNMEQDLELANQFNITFTGKEDPSNTKSEKEISLNYSDSVNFPLTYRKTNNVTGIQTKYIGSSFIAVKNDEKISGLKKINQLLTLQNIEISDENIQNLKTAYFDNILNTLDDSKFSTVKEENLTGYTLTLTGEEFKNILVQMLEVLKTDTNTCNTINKLLDGLGIDTRVDENSIDDFIESINDLELNDNVEMTVYATGGNLSRVDIAMEGNTLTVNKEGNDQEVTYTISLNTEEQDTSAIFTAKYSGLNSDNVTETYELTLEGMYGETDILQQAKELQNTQNTQDPATVSNEKEMIQVLMTTVKANKIAVGEDSAQISDTDVEEELSSGEDESYTDMRLEKETDTTFSITFVSTGDKFVIHNTGEIIEEPEEKATTNEDSTTRSTSMTNTNKYTVTNNVQFKDSVEIEDLTEDNAVILNEQDQEYVSNLMSAIQERMVEVNQVQMEELGVSEDQNPIQYLIPSFLEENQANAQIDEQSVNAFNAKFELYQSTNTKGATVKGLLTTIQNNNETSGNSKIEEINMDGEEYEVTDQNITYLKSSINVDDAYRVEFEKDSSTGLIYRAVINKR